MLFVLAGPSYVGKKTSMAHFIKLYSFNSIIPYTTKPSKRSEGEIEGIQYHYVENERYGDIANANFIYDKPFDAQGSKDNTIYAYRKIDIEDAIKSYSNFIIHASVGNASQIYDMYKKNNEKNLYVIFLDYKSLLNKEFFSKKYPDPIKGDNDPEFIRRYLHAKKEHDYYVEHPEKFDEIIKEDYIHLICDQLEEYILPKLTVMPTSPDKIPGPLSDNDIVYMVFNRKQDKLIVKLDDDNNISSEEALREILCGCSMHISLSEHIRKIKKRAFDNWIDMRDDNNSLDHLLKKIYPEESIAEGYILKPNETILCSSREYIEIPGDVFAIVSSKFSYTQLGLSIELGTSTIQAGHKGKIHFQIKNNTENYICIYPGISVAQLVFFRTVQPSSEKYSEINSNKYDKFQDPPISKFRKNNMCLDALPPIKQSFMDKLLSALSDLVTNKLIGLGTGILMSIITLNFIDKIIDKYTSAANTFENLEKQLLGESFSIRQLFIITILIIGLEGLFVFVGRLILKFLSEGYKLLLYSIKKKKNE